MSEAAQRIAIEEIAKSIDIPDSAYEKAEKRYQDLGAWFSSSRANCSRFNPYVYPQGSFRLGTVIQPTDESEQYDLDMGCRLQEGISKLVWSQKQLKCLVGADLDAYRTMRGIKEGVEEKHRCWCLNYADDLSFHMDIVPSIPEEDELKKSLRESMKAHGTGELLAESVAAQAGAITDNRLSNYAKVSPEWLISNSQGYALWFESRMRLELELLEKSLKRLREAQIDKLPLYKRRSPLQRCVQILKRHRDTMFTANPDAKPASIIVTTLAAMAYEGESDVVVATRKVLERMGGLVQPQRPKIPNPINPREDFADRWYTEQGRELNLEANFWRWLRQAQTDIGAFGLSDDADYLLEKSVAAFKATIDPAELKRQLRLQSGISSFATGGVATQTPRSPVDHRGGSRFG